MHSKLQVDTVDSVKQSDFWRYRAQNNAIWRLAYRLQGREKRDTANEWRYGKGKMERAGSGKVEGGVGGRK